MAPAPEPHRPDFPGYGIATEAKGMLPWSFVTERMERSRNYWICTARPDGRPHTMPVWGVWLDDALHFGTDPASVKGRNLAANPALAVHLESGDECVILEGVAEELDGAAADLLARFGAGYKEKYGFGPDVGTGSGSWVLRARVAFAWREEDYPKSATCWTFDAET